MSAQARSVRAAARIPSVNAAIAVVVFAVTAVLVAAYGPLYALVSGLHPAVFGFPGATAVGGLAFASMGLLVALRQRSNPVGWLMLTAGLLLEGVADAQLYSLLAYRGHGGALWAAPASLWVGSTLWGPALGLLPLGLLLFPDGRLASWRWRLALAVSIALDALFSAALISFITSSMFGGPITVSSDGQLSALEGSGTVATSALGQVFRAAFPLLITSFAIGVAGLVINTVNAHGERRQQMKWFAFAAALGTVGLIAYALAQFNTGTATEASALTHALAGTFVLTLSALPVATAVAVFRYHLYDIDIIISRTLVYGSLAALITGVYVGIAVGIGELVGSGGRPNLGLSILATAIVAVGFQPARERLQRIANRLVYGNRATPYQVLSEFSSNVAGSYAADEVLPRMARLLQQGTSAEVATVWLRGGSELLAAATHPEPAGDVRAVAVSLDGSLPAFPWVTRAVEVRHQGELLGALSVNKRHGESLTPVEEKLLDDLAHQAGLVLKNVGLTADLQRRLEELRASRQRLVSAQDAERRKLERNLHDGAQQHLVALKVKLGLAEMLTARDPDKAKQTLQELKSDTDEALETLRDLARGIYPPLLAEKGLAVALESQARKATVPVQVAAVGIGRYAQDVEATAYFCVLEALQNVQKYAQASHVLVRLSGADGALRFEVEDDGRGFDVEHVQRGAGLTNMEDRLDALDGRLTIESSPGRGCHLVGTAPTAAVALARA
ncbi:MAG: histidine kinase [Candidatus Dormibacteria bacterium]